MKHLIKNSYVSRLSSLLILFFVCLILVFCFHVFVWYLGRPQPRLTWWHENKLLDESYTAINEKKVKNELQIDKLERHHLNAVLTCQASNNNITAPISAPVSLNLNCKYIKCNVFSLSLHFHFFQFH